MTKHTGQLQQTVRPATILIPAILFLVAAVVLFTVVLAATAQAQGGRHSQETLTSAATASVPATPDVPSGNAVFVGGVDLEWNDVPGADSYDVQLFRNGQWAHLPGDGIEIAFYGAGAIISGLDPESTLWFRVRAGNSHGSSNWSAWYQMNSTDQYASGQRARPANVAASGAPAINGAAQTGQVLTADTTGIEDENGLDRVKGRFQWVSSDGNADTDIAGATNSTYTPVVADVGKTIKVRVAFTDRGGYAESLTGGETAAVAAVHNTPATGAPTISGTAQVGETLTADTSAIADADGLTNASYSYQWAANDGTADTDMAGATDSTYTVAATDEGNTIKVRVSFTDDAGNEETLGSAATAAVAARPNSPAEGWLHLSGMAEVGQAMLVVGMGRGYNWGIHDADGLTNAAYNFQWVRSDGITDVEIPDATDTSDSLDSSYTLADAAEGKYIKVRVSYTDDAGNKEMLTSSSTTAVTARPSTSDLGAASALTVDWSEGEEQGNELNWTAPEGTITGYQILRLETPTRSLWWEPYAYECTPLMEVHVSDTGGDATTFTDTDVAEGASYTYSVRAVSSDGIGRKSSYSTPTPLQYRPPHTPFGSYWPSGAPGTPYQVPTNLASSQIKNGIGLTWEAPESTWTGPQVAVTGYQILRRSPEQCDFGYRVYVENTNSTDTHWADRDVVSGTRYEYHVRAVNDVGAGRLDRSISTSLRPTTLVVGPGPNNPAIGTPTITGTAQVGETLTADPSGIADADGMHWASLSYQWFSSRDTEIEGATSPTYTLQASDANKAITVRVDFMDDLGYEESLTSAASAAVSSNVPATGAPAITGTVEVGETLTADTSGISDADGLDNVSFSYQWIRSDGTDDWDVDGATAATYTIIATDVGHALKLRVRFTDDEGNMESLTSAVTVTVPIEVTLTFNIEGTTVTCDSYNVHAVNVPIVECDDPISTVQGANGEIDVEIEVVRSVNSQLYKFDFGIYEVEDSLGNIGGGKVNDLCLGPGLADSASIEAAPDDGTGPLTYTDDGTIFELCSSGTYQLIVYWYRYNDEDQEYEYAGTIRRYFFITSNGEVDTSIEKVKWISALYPDPPISHGEVQIEATKEPEVLNRELVTYSLSIGGLVPDSDPETTDYVVRLQVIGTDSEGTRRAVPWCHVGDVGYSYQLKTVAEDGVWAMQAHLLGSCLTHWFPDTLRIELFDGTDLTDYSEPIVLDGSNIISHTGELQYPKYGTHEFIAGKDIAFRPQPTIPEPTVTAPTKPTINGTAQVGETLTVDTSGMAAQDGESDVSFRYQWVSNDGTSDTAIPGGTDSTYTLVAADEGKTIKVRVYRQSTVDHELSGPSLVISFGMSIATEVVTLSVQQPIVNSPATGELTISGPVEVGETLTVDTSGIADANGLTSVAYQYQWLADGSDIAGATATTYTLTDADEGAVIKVRVSFTDDAGNEEELTSQATDVVAVAEPAEPPAKPTGLSAAPSHDRVVLSWDDPQDDTITGYVILRRNRATTAPGEFTEVASDTGSAATTYTDHSVSAETLYTYRIKAINDHGLSELSHWVRGDTPAPPVPAKPTGLRAASSHDRVVLSWDDPQDDTIAGYMILRRNRATTAPGEFTEVASDTGSTATTYTDHNVSAETLYTYRIKAINDHGLSELSRWVRADTPTAPANSSATGAPTISGMVRVGETLTADTTGIADADGLTNASYSYQWVANDGTVDTDIAGATDSTYTVSATDGGNTIKVRVSFTDDAGNQETLTSVATEEVAFAVQQQVANTPATGAPIISGTAQVGETLTADTSGISDQDGLTSVSYSYQWLADGADIAGATSTTYTLTDADEGAAVKVMVSFTDDAGNDETLTSAATDTVEARPNSPATGAPSISGTAQVGETLTADTSGIADSDGLTNAVYAYQWLADGTDIAGATDSTYTLTDTEEGKTVQVRVSFTDDAGNEESLTSAGTGTVEARPNTPATGQPTILGTAQVGETLTADTPGIADADGLENATYGYQWLADGVDISGATTGSYTLVGADEGAIIQVQVSFTDDSSHAEELTSAETDAVEARPNSPAAGLPTISGEARVGETLTADTSGIADQDGLTNVSYGYQWVAGGTDLGGATGSTYTLTSAEVGKTVQVSVSFTDDAGNEESLTSAATAAVTALERPGKPQGLTGTVAHDVVSLTWDNPDNDSITGYQILRRNPDVHDPGQFEVHVDDTGSAATSYVDRDVSAETRYVYRIKARNAAGLSARSHNFNANTPEAPNNPATGAPTIEGEAVVGETLTADTSGIADADGLANATFSYQWIVTDGGAEIEVQGATEATYTLISIDAGLMVRVRVSFTDDAGNDESLVSAVTAVVAGAKQ